MPHIALTLSSMELPQHSKPLIVNTGQWDRKLQGTLGSAAPAQWRI
jgi:hypothetical protein